MSFVSSSGGRGLGKSSRSHKMGASEQGHLALSLSSLLSILQAPTWQTIFQKLLPPLPNCHALSVFLYRLGSSSSGDSRGDGLLPGLRGQADCELLLVGQQICTGLHIFLWGGRGVQRNINLAKVTETVKCHQHQKNAFMNFIIHIALQRNSNLKPSLSNPHRLDSCNLCVPQVWPQAWSIHYSRHPGLPAIWTR